MATKTVPGPKTRSARATANIANIEFEPALTFADLECIEASYDKTWGVARRVMCAVFTRTREELVSGFTGDDENQETMFAIIDHITAYEEHMKAGAAMAQTAIARLLAAGLASAERTR